MEALSIRRAVTNHGSYRCCTRYPSVYPSIRQALSLPHTEVSIGGAWTGMGHCPQRKSATNMACRLRGVDL
jgi:hypothetical protein